MISPAKTMRGDVATQQSELTEPRFLGSTRNIVEQMVGYTATELAQIFRVSGAIARELRVRFQELAWGGEETLAAINSYDGVVYKHFKGTFTAKNREYLQRHLRISSLLYGLLRPYDGIRPYRMEGFVRLRDSDERVDRYWRDIQTQTLIDDVNSEGGVLLYLASKEEQSAFNWREVSRAVKVIDIKFLQHKDNKLRQVVIYTKMARGEMLRYAMQHDITNPEELKTFEWEGYRYNETLSSDSVWTWVMD